MSAHIFDPEVAKQVGVNAAVIYQNIVYWCEKNAANGKHIHDGRAWTYNSVRAFADMFPYLTGDQIRRALEKLEQEGLIGVGSHGEDARDRTKWFCDLRQTHLALMPAPFGADANSYKDTDVNTDINNRYKPDTPDGGLFSSMEEPQSKEADRFDEFWKVFPKKAGKPAALKAWQKAIKTARPDAIIAAAKVYAGTDGVQRGFVKHPQGWLNEERFNDADLQPVPVSAKVERWAPGGYVR
jgi:hypothetical protein